MESGKNRPGLSIFLATACGLGYLPKAPGTWGSLGGLLLTAIPWAGCAELSIATGQAGLPQMPMAGYAADVYLIAQSALGLLLASVGVFSAAQAARFWGQHDPQRVVLDEVSGQHLALLVGCSLPISRNVTWMWQSSLWGFLAHDATLNWKYLVAGFILFRAFDIWKPFPARHAERLPGGWGIMADDWIAGLYAAIGLWIARAAGL